jgi:hypothetical protein
VPDDQRAGSDDAAGAELVSAGTDLAGALTAVVFGFVVAGPPGAAIGATLGVAVQHTARFVVGRLNRREEERVGAALAIMDADTREREARGERPREDGFFDTGGGLRPEAEELLEGVLRQAAGAHEEQKLPLLAFLYSTVAHDESISAGDAIYFARVAGELTYRQFVALSVVAHRPEYERVLAEAQALHDTGERDPDDGMILELNDLANRNLVGAGDSASSFGPVTDTFQGLYPRGKLDYATFGLLPAGDRLVRATRAREIAPAERERWLEELRGRTRH